ncbi:MAG: hypothetical protein ABIH03_11540 [Pseudomonadota bacterium]
MSIPSRVLRLKRVLNAIPAYGLTYDDRSRPGLDGHRRICIGKRGRQQSVQGVQYYLDIAAATQAKAVIEALQGYEVLLKDELENMQWQVFVHGVAIEKPEKIECSLANITYRLRIELEITRTA